MAGENAANTATYFPSYCDLLILGYLMVASIIIMNSGDFFFLSERPLVSLDVILKLISTSAF